MTSDTAYSSDRFAQGAHRQPAAGEAPDVIFVRDLVLPCRIGIHSEEREGEQRVRFSIEIAVDPGATRDRRSPVVCYDAIIGGVRRVINAGHINLMETLAERVAEACLALEGARKVHLRVEKLDRVPGAALGVEIVRLSAAPANGKVVPLNPASQE